MLRRMLLLAGLMTWLLCAGAQAQTLQITEACGDNDFVWTLGFEDYLELHNPGDEPLRLSDYTLRVDSSAARLPDVTLAPGGYFVLVCDGDELPKLPKDGFSATLHDASGQAVDAIDVPEHRNRVWQREGDLACEPSPGHPNTPAGQAAWHQESRSGLIISEAVSANYAAHAGARRGSDAVELCNAGSEVLLLSDYCLSDDRHDPTRYALPAVALRPGECYVVDCDARTTGFRLSADGETVYLATAEGVVIDALNLPALPLDASYGRGASGAAGYLPGVSLGESNPQEPVGSVAAAPVFSVETSGYHREAFEVTVSGESPIYYTTDGSAPHAGSALYTGPILIGETTALQAVSMPEGRLPSATATAVYQFGTEDYALPCLFVTVDHTALYDKRNGLLHHTADKDIEVPAHAALLSPYGDPIFSERCGLAVAGQTSRNRQSRGWKLIFRPRYGVAALDVPVFEDDFTGFDSLVLRLGSTNQPIHDVFAVALGQGYMEEVLWQRYRPVNLFVAGEYYGVYFLREHVNEQFVTRHLGGTEDQVDIVQGVNEVKAGSGEDWFALMDYCRHNDLAQQEHFDHVAAQVDLTSVIDYFIWRPYTGDPDHPNIRYVRVRNGEDPRWHLVMYDLDWAFQNRSVNMKTYVYTPHDSASHCNVLITALLRNEGFRQMFLERLSFHMTETFQPDRLKGLLSDITRELEPDMERHQRRWGSSLKAWKTELNSIRYFIKNPKRDRRTILLQETKGYFRLSDEQMADLFPDIPLK